MALKKESFVRYNEKKKTDAITIWLNKEERAMLEQAKKVLEQEKDSTAFKQLAYIGSNLIGDDKMKSLLAIVFKNKRNNQRLGIHTFE